MGKQNLTVSLDQRTIRRARVLAAERGMSISKLVAESVDRLVARADEYEVARTNALALLQQGFRMGSTSQWPETACMIVDRVFVDTNVLVYAHNADESAKHEVAKERIAGLWQEVTGVISTQVMQELFVTVTKKIPKPLDRTAARALLQTYRPWISRLTDPDDILRACEIGELDKISFWDALVVVSASRAGAQVLLTEDLNHGQIIEGVRIENPFL